MRIIICGLAMLYLAALSECIIAGALNVTKGTAGDDRDEEQDEQRFGDWASILFVWIFEIAKSLNLSGVC